MFKRLSRRIFIYSVNKVSIRANHKMKEQLLKLIFSICYNVSNFSRLVLSFFYKWYVLCAFSVKGKMTCLIIFPPICFKFLFPSYVPNLCHPFLPVKNIFLVFMGNTLRILIIIISTMP